MMITYHREKLINAMIYFARNTLYCGTTKLLKLLYFLDFKHFKETGKSVTGQDYYAWDMGPVPKDVFDEISKVMRPDMQAAIHPLPAGEEFQKIDYLLAIDSRIDSLPIEEAVERMKERDEVRDIFGET